MQSFSLSAKTILYSVALCGANGIYGIPNVLASVAEKDYPALINRAKAELFHAGCAEMDFDGSITPLPEFITAITACTDCRRIIFADVKNSKGEKHFTYYCAPDSCYYMENTGGAYEFTCLEKDGYVQHLADLLSIRDAENPLKAATLESEWLKCRDIERFVEKGCARETAELILDSLTGKGTFCAIQALRVEDSTAEMFVICGAGGAMQIALDYSSQREDVVFEPITRDAFCKALRKMVG